MPPVLLLLAETPSFGAAISAEWAVAGGGTEIVVFSGYRFGGGISVENGRLEFDGAADFGGAISYASPGQPELHAEFLYMHQRTGVYLNASDVPREYQLDLDLNYFLVGATYDFVVSKRFVPFAGIYLGGMTADPVGNAYRKETFLALAPAGGAKYYVSPRFGLRADARLMGGISFSRDEMFCSREGCLAQISGRASILQADISLGALVHF